MVKSTLSCFFPFFLRGNLLSVKLSEPFCSARTLPTERKAVLSCHDFACKVGDHDVVSTRTGLADPRTGILPSVFTLTAVDMPTEDSAREPEKTALRLELGRPVKIAADLGALGDARNVIAGDFLNAIPYRTSRPVGPTPEKGTRPPSWLMGLGRVVGALDVRSSQVVFQVSAGKESDWALTTACNGVVVSSNFSRTPGHGEFR